MLNWLKHGKIKFKLPPDPRDSSGNVKAYNVTAANDFVSEIQRFSHFSDMSSPAEISTPMKRKRDE